MWKSLNHGDRVLPGDTIRYFPGSPRLTSSREKVYDVVKSDLHYFEIVARSDKEGDDEPYRKIVKYMDIGYHISLEVWSGEMPFLPQSEKGKVDKRQ